MTYIKSMQPLVYLLVCEMFSLTLSVLTLNVPSEVWVWLKVEAHWPTFGFLQKVKAVGFSFQTWTHPFFFQLSEICSVFVLIVNHTFWFCMVSREYQILWAICMKAFIMLLYPCCCFFFFSLLCLPRVCFLSCLFFVVFLCSPVSSLFPHTPQPGVADTVGQKSI